MTSKTLLFDLGGVIIPWVGFEAMAASQGISRQAAQERFVDSPILAAFETGETSDAEFAAEFLRVFPMDVPQSDFFPLWNSWLLEPFPGVLSALSALKTRHTTACLSNTNRVHWVHIQNMLRPDETFHHAFASQHIGASKPDPQSYRIVLDRMGVAAEDVIFFEDTAENIEGARAIGIETHAVDRAAGVLPVLRKLGLVED